MKSTIFLILLVPIYICGRPLTTNHRWKRAGGEEDEDEDSDFDLFPEDVPMPTPIPADATCYFKDKLNFNTDSNNKVNYPRECSSQQSLTRFSELAEVDSCNVLDATADDLRVSQSAASEADLVLARGDGIFMDDVHSPENVLFLDEHYVCTNHRQQFGYEWYQLKKKSFMKRIKTKQEEVCMANSAAPSFNPIHTSIVPVRSRHVTREESRAARHLRNFLLPIGLPVCSNHKKELASLTDEYEKMHAEDTGEPVQQEDEGPYKYNLRPRKDQATDSFHCSPDALLYGSQFSSCQTPEPGVEEDDLVPVQSSCPNLQLPEYVTQITDLQKILREFAKRANLKGVHFATPQTRLSELSPGTVYNRVSAARLLVKKVYEVFSPRCAHDFEQLVLKGSSFNFWSKELPGKLDQVVQNIIDAYTNAECSAERLTALSLIAPSMSYAQMEHYLPGITHYAYKTARDFARRYHTGAFIHKTKAERIRPRTAEDRRKVASFVAYFTSDLVVTELPFGTVKMKTREGKITIPATVRNMRATRIAEQYLLFLKQTGQEHLKMSKRKLIDILKCCTARTSKALAGIDYYTAEASVAFGKLLQAADEIAEINKIPEWKKEITTTLKESKQYLKLGFKLHLKRESKISDHCFAYALSDPKDPDFQQLCDGHDHDQSSLTCNSCERLNSAFDSLLEVHKETQYDGTIKQNVMDWTISNSIKRIQEYKAHQVRAVWQDKAKKAVLDNLAEDQVFITMDFAMKYIPRKGREGQSGWFGKKGMSWHISVAEIVKNGKWYTRTYVHVLGSANQNSGDVTAILMHMLEVIKDEQPQIKFAIIRSDNAGCYKSSSTIGSILEISKGPITISRWMFSEPQTGKGPADRAANRVKRHVNMYVDENKDAVTPLEFVTAASSYKGLRDVSFFIGHVQQPQPGVKQEKTSIEGITKLHDFKFSWSTKNIAERLFIFEMRAWRMSGIGVGKVLSESTIQQLPNAHMFIVSREKHENHLQKQPAAEYDYWRTDEEPEYPDSEDDKAEIEREWNRNGVPLLEETDDTEIDEKEPYVAPTEEDKAEEEEAEEEEEDDKEKAGADNDEGKEGAAPAGDQEMDEDMQKEVDSDQQPNPNTLFDCDVPGCVRRYKFYGNLLRHKNRKNHLFLPQRETLQDIAQALYKQNLETLHKNPTMPQLSDELDAAEVRSSQCRAKKTGKTLKLGWALHEKAVNNRFNKNQLSFMDDAFNHGKNTGRKLDAAQVANEMPYKTIDDIPLGDARFSMDEYLSETQIASYFSRRAKRDKYGDTEEKPAKKRKKQPVPARDDLEIENENPEDSDVYTYVRRDEHIRDSEFFDTIEDTVYENLDKCDIDEDTL